MVRWVDRATKLPLPFGLSSPFGTLYGWTIYEKLHTPEAETIAFFRKHLREGDRIADVGANIGFYTLLFSSLVGPQGKVIAFEPEPRTFKLLTKAAGRLANVTLVPRGISAEPGTLTLYSSRAGDGLASTVYASGAIQTRIDVTPLRDYPEQFDWIKIDIEGAELAALKGLRAPTRAVIEVAQVIQERHGGGVRKFLGDVEELGYRVHLILDEGETTPYTGANVDALRNNIYLEPR